MVTSLASLSSSAFLHVILPTSLLTALRKPRSISRKMAGLGHHLCPVDDVGQGVEAGPLEAGVEEAVHEEEGTDGEEPGEEGQAEHGHKHVLPHLIEALVEGAHHGLHPHQGEDVAGDEQDQGREEEEEVEGPFGVRPVFLEANDDAGLGVVLEVYI